MSYDQDFRTLLELDDEERRAAQAEHVRAMLDDAAGKQGEESRSLLDAVGRARLDQESGQE